MLFGSVLVMKLPIYSFILLINILFYQYLFNIFTKTTIIYNTLKYLNYLNKIFNFFRKIILVFNQNHCFRKTYLAIGKKSIKFSNNIIMFFKRNKLLKVIKKKKQKNDYNILELLNFRLN